MCCAVLCVIILIFSAHAFVVVVVVVVVIFSHLFSIHMHLTRRCARGGHVGASQYFVFSDLPVPRVPTAEMIYPFLPRIAMDSP